MDHVTPVLDVPATVAENCCVCDPFRKAVTGETETVTVGLRVTVALAVFVGSATEVAVTFTIWTSLIDAGDW